MSTRLAAAVLALCALSATARCQDTPPPPPPKKEQVSADDASAIPRADEVVVTALRREGEAFDAPASVSVIGERQLKSGPDARSLPNSLQREPGVLLQKTGPGQSSPFLRGFTGFRTLLMMDGIRINNSVFREGPNQYWGTVDSYAVDRLELTRGPSSVLWGSDAIGGAVNALTRPAQAAEDWAGRWFVRYSTAERSFLSRYEVEGGVEGEWALRAGWSDKDFGNIKAGDGSGNLSGTSYDERDLDFRLDVPLDGAEFTLAGQRVRQNDVPRTHVTIDAVTFHGTTPGTEIRRDLTQEHNLLYARLGWDGDGLYDQARATLSWQRQEEEQERLRTGNRFDESGFDVKTWGSQLEFESDTSIGLLTWGFENWKDRVESFRNDYTNGALTLENIQGPVGDDSEYQLFGAYVQDEIEQGDFTHVLGLRWSYAHADSDRVDNPDVAGSDPATPGNVIGVNESYAAFVGSARSTWRLTEDTNLYGGLSQGFRAPNLSDLTSELTDSGIESATPDLDPEYYTQFELGAKTEQGEWRGDVAAYYTWIDDMVVQSPTGEVISGVPVLVKDNVGDGHLYGFEARGERTLGEEWTAFGALSWMTGKVDQFDADGQEVEDYVSRLLPFTAVVGCTWHGSESPWAVTADSMIQDEADKLSLKDESDTQRIPPGGTPGYGVVGLRASRPLGERAFVTVALENLFDKDYRIHGSGVNEPGRNLVVSWDVRF
ncbi:MAG: TonB-dependent receptor [Planctomycetes bacterium]|nr:TonB-dependent receptor [Planctomycetota bacterium]